MELQALLVLCGLGVAGVAVVLLMGLFSASGTSYEEAIAQQRRATTELLALAESKNKPKKRSKKAIKKLAKKERNKENVLATTGSEMESEGPAESGAEDETVLPPKPHVEFCPPVVVDISQDTPPNVKIRKRGKDLKVKPILINKDDPSCLSDPSTPPSPTGSTVSNHFEEIHPKDEFELLQSALAVEKISEKKEEIVEKKESKPVKQTKGSKAAAKPSPPTEPAKEEAKEERTTVDAPVAPKEQRKTKKIEKKVAPETTVEPPKEEVIPPLNAPQPSELTTEKLLKQALASTTATAPPAPAAAPVPAPAPSPPGGKNKKKKAEVNVLSLMAVEGGGVNVGELVRVVRDAALSRTEIQILTDALLNKHHDPLPEHSEWTEGPNNPIMKLKKQLADKEKALASEMEASKALHAKLKELRTSLNSERSRAAAGARAAEDAGAVARAELHTLQARLQRLIDENHALTNEKHMLQSKIATEGERVQMEMHIQRLTESEAALVQQLNQLQAEVAARALEAGQARCDAVAARDSLVHAQQHHQDLLQQLQELQRVYSECEQLRHCAEQRAQNEQRHAQDTLAAMGELQNEVQRMTARAQAADAEVDKLKQDIEKQKQQWSSEISSLKEQLLERESELAELKQLKAVPTQNGLSQGNTSNDQHKAAELAKVESMVESLRAELASAQRSNHEQRDQFAKLQDQLAQYQDKNNELRTKNWKVMEALQTAEKALQNKAASALPAQSSIREAILKAEETHYSEVVNVLRSACPALAPRTPAGRGWLQTFADNLKKELEKKSALADTLKKELQNKAAPVDDSRVKDLLAENEKLQGVVDKYKKIIDDTEGVLSRLQQNVSKEEERWAEQLAKKQRELEDLRQKTVVQMQKKIDTLQTELQQARAANHNHSFADAERFAEERLLEGLSDKYKADSCNGPLQVGLEEK